jgi:type IV pilus assembly protein PilA
MLRKIRKMLQQQEGFTLVELMIVVVILGILAGVGIQQYGRVQENARISADDANVRIITSAVQMYLMVETEPAETITPALLVTEGYLAAPEPVSPWNRTTSYTIVVEVDEEDNEIPTEIRVTNSDRPS